MIISHAKKFIFIHNYKVAGTSIHHALEKYNNPSFLGSTLLDKLRLLTKRHPAIYTKEFEWHINAKELKCKLPANIYDSYFKFGFVRNPWDWQVSLYTYMLKDENKHHHHYKLIKSMENFDEYIEWRVDKDLHLQKDFFYDENDTCLIDFIGKYENLYLDFNSICKRLNVNKVVPHLNKSRENNINYINFYSKNSIKMVHEAFKEDIDLFGYTYPQL